MLEDAPPLRHQRHAAPYQLMAGHMAQLLTQKMDAARPAAQQSRHSVQRGGFARAVGADQRHHLALLHMKGHVLHGVDAAVIHIDVLHLQHAAHDAVSFFLPRYASMTASFRWISSGVPLAMIWPKFSTQMPSQMFMTRFMSCSMSSTAI